MTPFHVGMKVVSIQHFKSNPEHYSALPVKGNVYTIREIKSHPSWNGLIGLLFEEITGRFVKGWEYSFDSTRFRPVVKTDMSVFTSMLSKPPVPKRVPADA